jgi:hypothetical protein
MNNSPVPTSSDGFLKVSASAGTVDSSQKAALIRRGNELFNRGEISTASRIFVTLRYSDGLIRVGNYLYEKGEPLEAIRMYWLARDRHHIDEMSQRMAQVLRTWLHDKNAL